jgi:4-hydroxybenzoyl-CoA thioesterase
MVEDTTEVQVRWSDVDPAGVVFYPRFFEWYDLGCEALFASLGLPWPEAFPKYEIVGVPIVESGSKFKSPVRYGDALTIRSMVAWVKTRSFRMEHEISVGARLCSAGFEVRAWVGRPVSGGAGGRGGPGWGAENERSVNQGLCAAYAPQLLTREFNPPPGVTRSGKPEPTIS